MKQLYVAVILIMIGSYLAVAAPLVLQGQGGGGKRYYNTFSKVEPKGAWISQATYSSTSTRQHSVTHNGSTWLPLATNTNQTPTDGNANWFKQVAKGDTGVTGPQGPAGSVTAASGLNITQRQMSSGTITLLPPVANDPTGIRGLDITVAKGSNRAGHLQYSSGKLLVDHAEIAGTGGSGTAFATVKRSVLTNMSSGKLYEAGAFAKHTLPSAAASKSVRVFANATSARVSVNTSSGVVKDFGGITSTAGYSVRIPKGSVYEFVSTAADNTWYAIKQAGTAITQYVLEFIASLSLDSSSTDHGSVAVGSESPHVTHTLSNPGGATATNVVFTNTSSALFRNVSSACGSTLAAGANCVFKTAYTPLSATTNSGHINITADGGLLASLALSGTGTASGISDTFDTLANWTNIAGTISVSGGKGHGTAGYSTTTSYKNIALGSNDHWAQADVVLTSPDYASLILASNGTTFYYVSVTATAVEVRASNGSWGGSYATTNANGTYTIKAQVTTNGSSQPVFAVWVNGTPITLSAHTDTINTNGRGQYVGVRFYKNVGGSDVTIDNLTANAGLAP